MYRIYYIPHTKQRRAYFVRLLAEVFTIAREETLHSAEDGITLEPEALRRLDPRAQAVLALFTRMEQITSSEVARTLGLSQRMAGCC